VKLVREHIIFEKFVTDSDPITDMGIGMMQQIKEWMKSIHIEFTDKDRALFICSAYGKTKFVKYLLDAGADVHTLNDNALHWACYEGYIEIVKILIDAGADVHAVNDDALRCASDNGHTDVVKLLEYHIANEKNKN